MSTSFGFTAPPVLLALLLLPPLFWILRRGAAARGARGTLVLALRLLVLASLIGALARPRWSAEVSDLAVAFVLDVSESVPRDLRDAALLRIERWFDRIPEGDRAALLIFGGRPSVEIPWTGTRGRGDDAGFGARLRNLESRLDLTESDLGAAVAFAEAGFPPGTARRIVLLSDGNATRGDLPAAARALATTGTRLDGVVLAYRHSEEVIVEGLHGPGRGHVGEPLQLRAVISSLTRTEAEIQLRENGEAAGPPERVRLDPGTNVFRFSVEPGTAGYFQYELTLRSEGDGNRANNVGRAGVLVGGPPRVIACSGAEGEQRLSGVLAEAGIALTPTRASELPSHPAGYVGADCVVFDDVAAYDLDADQLGALRDAVTQLGVGLAVIGGARSFGPGGYRGTPLADLLPVDLDTTNKKTLPKGALVIVLHSIEFDSGNTWAARICKAALQGLRDDDEAGVVYYDQNQGERWLFQLAPLGNRKAQIELIDGVRVGDMPHFHACFALATGALGKSDAAVKHVVVISDGDPLPPGSELIAELQAMPATISTICIEPHGPTSIPTMKGLARVGGGRFYQLFPSRGDLQRLPRLMLKEAATLRRAAISEEAFTPVILLDAPVLRGLGGFPKLGGYAITSMRTGAETILLANEKEGDPLLAAWHAGLGRVVAFTSDASSRWAREWLGWKGFGPFWSQVVRSTVLESDAAPFIIALRREGLDIEVEVEARGGDGVPRSDLALAGSLMKSGEEPVPFRPEAVAPGRYAARLRAPGPGHYLVRVRDEAANPPAQAVAVTAIDFAPEYRALRSDEGSLRGAAAAAGGIIVEGEADPFRHEFAAEVAREELWPWCLVLAALLLVLELGCRRLDIDLAGAWRRRRARRQLAAETVADEPAAPGRQPAETLAAEEPPQPRPAAPAPPPKESSPSSTLGELKKAKKRAEKRRRWQ